MVIIIVSIKNDNSRANQISIYGPWGTLLLKNFTSL